MSRVLLIHWNAEEAQQRSESLRHAGHQVEFLVPRDASIVRRIAEALPDVVVIDLSRRTAEGGGIAALLRQRKRTRPLPLVFVEGDGERLEKVRKMFPSDRFTSWRRVRSSIRNALRRPQKSSSPPGALDAYSGTPLLKKLGIKPAMRIALLGAPAGFEKTLGALPKDVRVRREARGRARLVLLFARSRTALSTRLPGAVRILDDKGGLWIAWPKKASGVRSDLTQSEVRRYAFQAGLVDYKICSIDEIWSGLLFARRAQR